jgi:hypothetical protein
MSNRTDFTLNDVRDYLIDTGAIREAEALLLGNDDKDKIGIQKKQTTVMNALGIDITIINILYTTTINY